MIAYQEQAEASPAAKIDYQRLISVLEQIEGGSNLKAGGALCWTSDAWKEETGMPFGFAKQTAASHLFAYKRLVRLASVLRNEELPVTPYTLACLWHHGLTGTMLLLKGGVASDYGMRASALYFCQ